MFLFKSKIRFSIKTIAFFLVLLMISLPKITAAATQDVDLAFTTQSIGYREYGSQWANMSDVYRVSISDTVDLTGLTALCIDRSNSTARSGYTGSAGDSYIIQDTYGNNVATGNFPDAQWFNVTIPEGTDMTAATIVATPHWYVPTSSWSWYEECPAVVSIKARVKMPDNEVIKPTADMDITFGGQSSAYGNGGFVSGPNVTLASPENKVYDLTDCAKLTVDIETTINGGGSYSHSFRMINAKTGTSIVNKPTETLDNGTITINLIDLKNAGNDLSMVRFEGNVTAAAMERVSCVHKVSDIHVKVKSVPVLNGNLTILIYGTF